MKILVAGWFSFEEMGASAGDLYACRLMCEWITEAGHEYEVAFAPPFDGGVDWRSVDPEAYAAVVFVCGPFGNGWPVTDFLTHFKACRLIGVNLSMLEPLEAWNPFDLLLERDSSVTARPDVTFLSRHPKVPVVGLILIDFQPEYEEKDVRHTANEAIERLVKSREMAVVPIDTRLDVNTTGLRSPAEVESLIARMDVVITTRLHGTVLALKNGVPAVAIDAVAGGHKVKRQAQTLGWPVIFTVEELDDAALQQGFDYCLTEEARLEARACSRRAAQALGHVRNTIVQALSHEFKSVRR